MYQNNTNQDVSNEKIAHSETKIKCETDAKFVATNSKLDGLKTDLNTFKSETNTKLDGIRTDANTKYASLKTFIAFVGAVIAVISPYLKDIINAFRNGRNPPKKK